MRKLVLSLAAFLILMFIGCTTNMVSQETIKNVERIIEHDINNKYTVEWQEPENKEILRKTFYKTRIRVFPDIEPGQAKWVRVKKWKSVGSNFYTLEYHVHTIHDLGLGSWNHGKHGSGTAHEIR